MLADVPTPTHDLEVKKLQQLATGKVVLETGTLMGHSAIAMAMTAERVFTIDTHQSDLGMGKWRSSLRPFLGAVNRYNLWGKIIVLVGKTVDVLPRLDFMRFDMAFIDAAHDYDSVRIEIELIYPLLNSNAIMAFHDYGLDPIEYSHVGVTQAVDELIEEKNMIKEDLTMSLLTVRKASGDTPPKPPPDPNDKGSGKRSGGGGG